MTAFHFYTALAVAKQSAWLSAKRMKAGDPQPLQNFTPQKGESFENT
jgi:hypothetical protein